MTDEQFKDLFLGLERYVGKRLDVTDAKVAALDARLTETEARLDAKIEKVETTLLAEFQKWASPLEARMRTHSATLRAIDLEMEALTDRVQKLEGNAG